MGKTAAFWTKMQCFKNQEWQFSRAQSHQHCWWISGERFYLKIIELSKEHTTEHKSQSWSVLDKLLWHTWDVERNPTWSFAGVVGGRAGVLATVWSGRVFDAQQGRVVLEADIVFVRAVDFAVVLVPGDCQGLGARHPSLHLHRFTHRIHHGLRGLLGEAWRDLALCQWGRKWIKSGHVVTWGNGSNFIIHQATGPLPLH